MDSQFFKKQIIFLILFIFLGFFATGCKSAASDNENETQTVDPIPGDSGTINTSGITASSVTVNWTKATDDTSAQSDLQYLVYYSDSDNIDSASDCETYGTAVDSYTADITTKTVSGLSEDITYYFNVVVKDEAGNKSAYTSVSATTSSSSPIPGAGGSITASNPTQSSITIDWTKATDDTSNAEDLQYLVYYSASNNITSVSDCETSGTAYGSYTFDIATKTVTGLTANMTYYFNVVVRDENGDMAAYYTVTHSTTN